MRVAFKLPAGGWLGGRNYLRSLFAAVRALPGNPITPVIFTGTHQGAAPADFHDLEVVRTSMLDRRSPAWFAQKAVAKITARDLLLDSLMQEHNISVHSHCFRVDGKTEAITLGWIPDFQHIHLPEFFSESERRLRDREFKKLCARCETVIVSSECARADLAAFAPEYAHKAELLRFVASPVPLARAAGTLELNRLYGFEGDFFLLPNQFWAHKNHRVVIDALRILKRSSRPFLVLATGSSEDNRNPSYFPALMKHAEQCDVLDFFRVLGVLPFDHLLGLMRDSVALINPSRFEGWSTSVEESKSIGKRIILSDIPVHREQAPPRGIFFAHDDPNALAEAMWTAYNEFDPINEAAIQKAAQEQVPNRQREFGEAYWRILKRASDASPV